LRLVSEVHNRKQSIWPACFGGKYEACYNYSGINDNRLLGLMNGSGANVLVGTADAYTDGDYVAAFFQYDRNGNEIIYADYNDGNGLNLLKSAAVYNGSGGTGTVSFMIGGAGWSTGRDCTADIYRVLIYGRHLGVPQMEWMVFSNFANRHERYTRPWHIGYHIGSAGRVANSN
jgi:hypothetical protein